MQIKERHVHFSRHTPLTNTLFIPLPSHLNSTLNPHSTGKKAKDRKDDVTGFRANTWLPSERRSVNDQRSAVEERDRERAVRDGVLDGSRAPKLTGRNRYMKVAYTCS